MVKVSVVIPVYNVENYLEECLDSIINQTLNDIEIICINDGSTDNSLKILENYQLEDGRIKVFNQINSGPAAARNFGIEKSAGEYIYFMDSDDYLELNALKELYDISVSRNLDFIIFKLINFDDGSDEKYTSDYYEMKILKDLVGDDVFDFNDLGDDVFRLSVSPPGKFFKKSFIGDIRFPEGVIFEDNLFFIKSIFKAKRVYFYDKHLYNRRIRLNSITTLKNRNFMDCIVVFNMIFDFLKEIKLFDNYKEVLYNRKILNTYNRFSQVDDEFKEEFFNRIKDDFLFFRKDFEEDNDFLSVISNTSRCIFYSAISSHSYNEFENEVELFKSKIKIRKLNKSKKSLKKELKKYKSTKTYKIWKFYVKFKNKLIFW